MLRCVACACAGAFESSRAASHMLRARVHPQCLVFGEAPVLIEQKGCVGRRMGGPMRSERLFCCHARLRGCLVATAIIVCQ